MRYFEWIYFLKLQTEGKNKPRGQNWEISKGYLNRKKYVRSISMYTSRVYLELDSQADSSRHCSFKH